MLRTLCLSLSAAAMLACAQGFETDSSGGTTPDAGPGMEEAPQSTEGEGTEEDPEEPEVFQPVDGDWVVVESSLLQDGCGLGDMVDRGEPGTVLILELFSESDFEMTFTTGGEIVSCVLDSETLDYRCDPEESLDQTARDLGLSAVMPVTLTSVGHFDTDSDMLLESTVDLSCEGTDCFWVEMLLGTTLPCQMVMQSLISVD